VNSSLNRLARTWRALWFPRGFLPLASVTLAIGLAAFTSALTMVESLLTAPPFPNHASIVVYGEEDRDPVNRAVSPMSYDAIGQPPGVVSRGAAQVAESVNVRSGRREKLARAQRVDTGFLPTLGVRSLLPEDPSIAFDRGVMLSHAFWQDWLAGDPSVVGRRISVNGEAMTVRGVLPPDYRFLADIDMLLPLPSTRASRDTAANLTAVARLVPGVSGDSVGPWMQARLSASAMPLRPGCDCIPRFGTMPLDVILTSKARPTVLIFFGCSLLVLVIAGVNLSNLMLTRALQRTHETCLMIAFGGLGWRSKVPLIADVMAICVGTLAIGLPLAHVLVTATSPFVPGPWLISALPIHLDWRACLLAALASIVVTTTAAILGAVHANPDRLLRTQFASGGIPPAGLARRARHLMVLVQTALATLLLVLGVATASRLWRVTEIPLGFQETGASSIEINPDIVQFPTLDKVRHTVEAIRAAAMRLPGVGAAGLSTQLPIGPGFFMPFRLPVGSTSYLQYAIISPGAMEAMGIILIAGRNIGAEDSTATPPVALVNQAYLDRFDSRGIGAWVTPASHIVANRPLRIVGVVADTRSAGAEHAAEPTVFVPFSQVDVNAYAFIRQLTPTFVVIRASGDTVLEPQVLQKLMQQAAPGVAGGPQQSFRQLARQATAEARRNAALAAMFAGMALALACIGLYAVQALEMTSRCRDIAVRDALGATPLDLFGHAVSRGMSMATPGVALGLIAAVALQRALEGLAFKTGTIDASVTAAVAVLMIFAALGAVVLPSVRAAAVRPVYILRGELTPPSWLRRKEGTRS
jgi:putative ABC transport system permease protein